jgi:hypothetical protein
MSNKPGLGGREFAVGQQRGDPALFQVTDDTGVSVIATPSPIINADNPERVGRWTAAAAATTPVDVGRQRETDALWDKYCQNRQTFIDKRHDISDAAADFLGIRDGDLDSPVVEHLNFGSMRHPDWMGRAERIDAALGRWSRMTANERADIPNRLAARNLARRLVKLEEKQQEQTQ